MPLVTKDLITPPKRAEARKKARRTVEGYAHIAAKCEPQSTKDMTPAQKMGIYYERKVGQHLAARVPGIGGTLWDHEWIEYDGAFAQPDFIIIFPSNACLLLEVKYTWIDCSGQLELYKDLLTFLDYGPVTACTVCRNLAPGVPRDKIVQELEDVVEGSVWQLRL